MERSRKFTVGRQSEQLLNEELYQIFGSIKHLLAKQAPSKEEQEENIQHNAIWLNENERTLYAYDANDEKWNMLYDDNFKQISQILSDVKPENPVYGQVWINDGMLWYFDSTKWQPVYAYDPTDGTSVTKHEDFLYLSPIGKGEFADATINGEKYRQYLVPDINTGRMYYQGKLVSNYEHDSRIAVKYPIKELKNGDVSWSHINPNRLIEVKKHIIRIDNATTYYEIPSYETELFGFSSLSPLGTPLMDGDVYADGHYKKHRKGIILSESAMQEFDFIVAIKYTFGWAKSIGQVHSGKLNEVPVGYYMGRKGPDFNMFVQGYAAEFDEFAYDPDTHLIDAREDEFDAEMNLDDEWEISFLSTELNEYGYIRQVVNNEGIIKPRHYFKKPLVLVAGEAMMGIDMDSERFDGIIRVENAKEGMAYCILELDDPFNRLVREGITVVDEEGNGAIWFENDDLKDFVQSTDGLLLFIDGVLIKKEQIRPVWEDNAIYVEDISAGQQYTLIQDKRHDLMLEDFLGAAYKTPYVDESLVFMNGKLILNDNAVMVHKKKRFVRGTYHNEVKVFNVVTPKGSIALDYAIWNEYGQNWMPATQEIIDGINNIAFSYQNGIESICINDSVNYSEEDEIIYYIYQYARTVEKPVHIYEIDMTEERMNQLWDKSDIVDEHGNKMVLLPTAENYRYGSNALQVFFNGVRQYDRQDFTDAKMFKEHNRYGITEDPRGVGFLIKEPFVGKIHYIVEQPEERKDKSCEREILTHLNRTDNPGTYRTMKSLIPGAVTVYIGGLRQSRDSFIILDNNTILFKDRLHLTGHGTGHMKETIMHNGEVVGEYEFNLEDLILIEVRQDHRRVEKKIHESIKMIDIPNAQSNLLEFKVRNEEGKKDWDLPQTITSSRDEILIFINGLFTGYRRESQYRVDEYNNSIVVFEKDLTSRIYGDDVYTLISNDRKLKEKYEMMFGNIEDRRVNNTFLLEWR